MRTTIISLVVLSAAVAVPPLAEETSAAAEPGSTPVAQQRTMRAEAVVGGRLAWRPCADDARARCAWLRVPRDWRRPQDGAHYRLAVRRLPASGNSRGPLVANAGGPGLGASEALDIVSASPRLRRRFDLVSWDPRGVGRSQPPTRSCPAVIPGSYRPVTGPFTWQGVAAQAIAQRSVAGRRCHARNRTVGETLGTWQVAHDVEALRIALGAPRITYVGYSYGTTIGRVYSQLFPTRVRAMLLDGVTSPVPTFADVLTTSRQGGEAAWRWVRGRLAPGVLKAYRETVDILQTRTPGPGDDRWSLWVGVSRSLAGGASAPAAVTDIICGTAAAAATPCPPTAGSVPSRLAATLQGSPIVTLVDCVDRSGRPGSRRLAAAMEGVDPVPAQNVLRFGTLCSGAPETSSALPTARGIRLRTAPLLVNGVGDQNTPFAAARRTARAFPGSTLLPVDTTTHGIFLLAGSRCVDRIGVRYLEHRRPPAGSTSCPTPGGER